MHAKTTYKLDQTLSAMQMQKQFRNAQRFALPVISQPVSQDVHAAVCNNNCRSAQHQISSIITNFQTLSFAAAAAAPKLMPSILAAHSIQ